MVCIAGVPCLIEFNLHHGPKDKILSSCQLQLNESTRGKDLYNYIEKCGEIQPDSFKLYLLSGGVKIDLSEMKDKTMSEIGVDFSFDGDLTKYKYILLVVDRTNTLSQKQVEYNLSTYNPPPPSPDHESVWSEFKSLVKPEILKSAVKPEILKSAVKPEILEIAAKPEILNSYVGLVNQAMTCYLNSLLQALYMTPEFRNALYNWEYVEGSEKGEANSIPYQLQKLFLNLQTSTKSAVETTALTKSFGWDSTEAWQQHDIQELCRVMFDALEQKFKNTEQADLINRLYEGKMIDYVKCLECSTEKSREDTFLDIPLPVRPFGSNVAYSSVEEALRAFVQYETLEGNNQYYCEKCNKKCDAHKGLKFTKFPYLLTLHLKRFDFDFKTFHRIKLNDKVTFPDILNLNPFISSTLNQESQSSEENIGLMKCDDSSTTDSGTLDDDYVPCENNVSNSNHSTNPDQDDDEGIDIGNGPSTSNCIVHNHENEKNRNSNAVKGPYNYELFSIMIHSGSASGGHYYAYIKDFRTQEWLCFNDQSVTEITHDDIQKTYGGGPSRSYYRASSSCANAYMLMYRQIDPVRNALPMQIQDFPKHIQELLKKMKENESNDRKTRHSLSQQEPRLAQQESCLTQQESRLAKFGPRLGQLVPHLAQHTGRVSPGGRLSHDIHMLEHDDHDWATIRVKVYCENPIDHTMQNFRLSLPHQLTLAENTEQAYKDFQLDKVVSLDQCRLVAYDECNNVILESYEGREDESLGSIWNKKMITLLLEIRDKDQKFEPYTRDSILTKVYVIDVSTEKLVEGPINIRVLLTQTVREYKQIVGNKINMDPDKIKIVLRKYGMDTILVNNDDDELQATEFCNLVNVLVTDAQNIDSFLIPAIYKIIKELENIITLRLKLPDANEEILEKLNIPSLEEKYKNKEKSVSSNPSQPNVNDSNHDVSLKSNEVPKSGKPEDVPVRSVSPQLVEGEEWNTPEQSNSEESSLSDSDKTLVGDAPEDDVFQLSCLPSKNCAMKIMDQIGLENWDNPNDDSEYYFKATISNPNQKFLRVQVDKRMVLSALKKHLEPYVGVPAEHFEIYRNFDSVLSNFNSDESECNCLFSQLVSYEESEELLRIKLGRALCNGEFTVKLYQFLINSPEPYKFLCEWTLFEGMTVAQAKIEILAEIKRKYDIDIPYERCRLRKIYLKNIFKMLLDDQKLDLSNYSMYDILIQELPDKEPVTNSDQIVLFVRKWSPEKKLEPFQEIVLDEKSIEELCKKLSLISDIPEKHIDVEPAKGLFPDSTFYQIPTTDIKNRIKESTVFIYWDNRETSKQTTSKEINEVAFQEVNFPLPSSSASRYSTRKEKALRINLDAE